MISIILPVYNACEYVDEMIASIVKQTYKDWELIIVEDCSQDNSYDKCMQWSLKDSRITVIENDKNMGQGESRNRGLERAQGDYIYFCDADDTLEVNLLETLLGKMQTSEADIICCDYWQYTWRVDLRKYDRGLSCCNCVDDKEVFDIYTRKDLPLFFPCIMWNKLYRRHVFNNPDIRFPREKVYFEDFYINCLIMYYGHSFQYVHEPLYHYYAVRENANNSNSDINKMVADLKYIFKKINVYFEKMDNYEEYACAFINHAKDSLRYHLTKKDATNRLIKDNEITLEINAYVDETYKNYKLKGNIYAFGSFCLRKAFQQMPYSFQQIAYMSVASAVKENVYPDSELIMSSNPYRTNVLKQDLGGNLETIWKKENYDDWLVVDLLDEHYGNVQINNTLATKSEFFEAYAKVNCLQYYNVPSDIKKWTQDCDLFVRILRKKFKGNKIVVIENYLSEGYGRYKQECIFEQIDEIKYKNEILRKKYEVLKSLLPEASYVEIPGAINYTYCRHQFACVPYYHNYSWYHYVAECVAQIMEGD